MEPNISITPTNAGANYKKIALIVSLLLFVIVTLYFIKTYIYINPNTFQKNVTETPELTPATTNTTNASVDPNENKLLADGYTTDKTDQELLIPLFGTRSSFESTYPLLRYYDKDIFVVERIAAKGGSCSNYYFYNRSTKTELASTTDDCYTTLKNDFHIFFVAEKQILHWKIGDLSPQVIQESILKNNETYSSGLGCMGPCITAELNNEILKATIYKNNANSETNTKIKDTSFTYPR